MLAASLWLSKRAEEITREQIMELSGEAVMKYMPQGSGQDEGVIVVWSDGGGFILSSKTIFPTGPRMPPRFSSP